MAKILFIDDRLNEVTHQWQYSGCENDHELLPLEPFKSIERTGQLVKLFRPDVIVVGYGLSNPEITGTDVICALRNQGFCGCVIANSGGGSDQFIQTGVRVDANVDRNAVRLKQALEILTRR